MVCFSNTVLTYNAFGQVMEQAKGGTCAAPGTNYTQILSSPAGGKLALMNGQTLGRADIPTLAGGEAVYGPSGLSYYRHSDWLGSSRLVSSPTPGFVWDGEYAPFGEVYNESTVNGAYHSFTGQKEDTVAGFDDFLFREYSAAQQGRWISPDPAGLAAVDITDPQSWNRYAYLTNNPLNAIDPLGLCNPNKDDCTPRWTNFDAIGQGGCTVTLADGSVWGCVALQNLIGAGGITCTNCNGGTVGSDGSIQQWVPSGCDPEKPSQPCSGGQWVTVGFITLPNLNPFSGPAVWTGPVMKAAPPPDNPYVPSDQELHAANTCIGNAVLAGAKSFIPTPGSVAGQQATNFVNSGAFARSINKIGFSVRASSWAGAVATGLTSAVSKIAVYFGIGQALYSAGSSYAQQVKQGNCGRN